MTSRLPHAALIAAAVLTSACFVPKSASRGAIDNGEQLRFRADHQRYKVRERQVTGSTDHYNASGDYIGTSEQARTVERTKLGPREVNFYQGREEIGEADFYRIGGDAKGAEMAEAGQNKLWWISAGGIGLTTAGIGTSVAGLAGAFGEGGMTAAYIGSSVLTTVGGYMLYYVILRRKDARLSLERARGIGVAF